MKEQERKEQELKEQDRKEFETFIKENDYVWNWCIEDYDTYIKNIDSSGLELSSGCLNVNKDMYQDICINLLGIANDIIPLKKSKRQNNYEEFIYIWHKN